MRQRWWRGVGALALGLGILALWVTAVSAQTLTPPYIIAQRWIGGRPTAVVVNPGKLAYVADELGKVYVFEGLFLTETIEIPAPSTMAVDPDHNYIYVGSYVEGNRVAVLQGRTLLGQTSPISAVAAIAVLTPTGQAYATLPSADGIAVLEGITVVNKLIPVGDEPIAVAANPNTGLVYVANSKSNNVSVLQGTAIVATVSVGTLPTAIGINPNTGYVYVSNFQSHNVSILLGSSVVATVPVAAPVSIAVDPGSGRVYVNNDTQNQITVLSGTQVIDIVSLTEIPLDIVVNPRSGYGYVLSGLGTTGAIAVISQTRLVETFKPVGYTPRDVAVDPVTDLAYVSLYDGRVAILGRTAATLVTIDPTSPTTTTLHCNATHNLPVEIQIPPGAVTQTVDLMCSPLQEADTRPVYRWAQVGFRLNAYRGGINQVGFPFEKPIALSVGYDPALLGKLGEEQLELRTWYWPQWAWVDSGITLIQRDRDQNRLVVELAHLSEYAVVGPATDVYLPIVIRKAR